MDLSDPASLKLLLSLELVIKNKTVLVVVFYGVTCVHTLLCTVTASTVKAALFRLLLLKQECSY